MALQQIDLDTVQPNNKRGVPGRTAMTIVNQNSAEAEQRIAETEQRVAAIETAGPQVDQRLEALEGELVAVGAAIGQEQAARADADAALAQALAAQGGRIVGKNRLINGNFDFWQRGTSFGGTTFAGYTADRFYVEIGSMAGCTCSRQPVTPGNPGFKADPAYAMQFDYTGNTSAAGHYLLLHQRAEDVRMWAGRPTMLSFTVFNSGSAGRQIAIEFIQHFGTGGSASITGLLAHKITLSAGFNYIEVPVTLPGVAGKSIGPNSYADAIVWISGGSSFNARNGSLGAQSGQLIFSALQWEDGEVATSFDQRPLALELAQCQRFYEKSYDPSLFAQAINAAGFESYGIVANGYFLTGTPSFKVAKRTAPSVTVYRYDSGGPGEWTEYGTTGSPIAGRVASITNVTPRGFEVRGNGAATGGSISRFHWTADAEF